MKKNILTPETLLRCIECYGEFDREDPLCKKRCGLRLRCAIESNQRERIEALDEIYDSEDLSFRSH